jgi:hypothetical protein
MCEQRYKVSHSSGLVWASELVGAKSCAIRIPAPENANMPEGQWYCHNPDCVVRECTIRCKLYGEELPTMHCPACSSLLKFNHWIGHETLVPVREMCTGLGDEPPASGR